MKRLGSKPTVLMSGRFGSTQTQVIESFMEFRGDHLLGIAQLMSRFAAQVAIVVETIWI
jgi:hypothetical protein